MSEKLAESITDAKKTCADGTAGQCAAAWDVVDELSSKVANQKVPPPSLAGETEGRLGHPPFLPSPSPPSSPCWHVGLLALPAPPRLAPRSR